MAQIDMSCCTTEVFQIPGPPGPAGADGADGTNGSNAYTTLGAAYTMPAELASSNATVVASAPFTVGQIVFVQFLGFMEVTAKPDATTLTLKNLEDAATSVYAGNAPAGTIAALGSAVVPAGPQGPSGNLTGPVTGGDLVGNFPAPDLGILTTKGDTLVIASGGIGTATRLAVGVNGTRQKADSTVGVGISWSAVNLGVPAEITGTLPLGNGGTGGTSAATARTSLAAAKSGVNSDITQLSAVTTPLTLAQGGTNAATAAAARTSLGVLGREGLIGSLTGVDLNTTNTDTLITVTSARFKVSRIIVEAASVSLTTVTAGLFSAAAGVGTIAANQALSALTTSGKFLELTISGAGLTDVLTGNIYFRTGTAQGAAATANVWVFGESFA